MRIVDLFSGLGGLTVGALEAARELGLNFEIYLASDFEESCASFYAKNFGKYTTHFHSGDIVDLNVYNLENPKIDYLFAGPPCQGHSDLNNKSRRNDPRNDLYLETLKVIEYFQPTVFVIENVPSVIHSEQGVVEELKNSVSNKYYIQELVVDFEELGIAQTRKRHIVIGTTYKIEFDLYYQLRSGIDKNNLRDVIGDIGQNSGSTLFETASRMTAVNRQRANYLYDNNEYDLPNNLRPKCHQGTHSYKSMYGRLSWEKPAQTITGGFGSMGQGRFLHPQHRRVLTPHEAARVQGLPDWLDYTTVKKRGELHQMIGNAVPPILSKRIITTLGVRDE